MSCLLLLGVPLIVGLIRPLIADCPTTRCRCSERPNGNLFFTCNSVSLQSSVIEMRDARVEGEVEHLTFVSAPDVTLLANTFLQFDALRELRIQGGVLSSIEPGAFNSLHLATLDLRFNNLRWLSGEMFTGIDGTTLENLQLDHNDIQHLRSNLQPFFSSISGSFSLTDNMLVCDCHLQWFVGFLNSTTATVMGANCGGVPVTDPSINFTTCQDICMLQYHNCHGNATCQPDTEGFCVCNPGFIGDGMSCENICDTNLSRCHTNASCQVDNMDVVCTCHPGFRGDGHTCTIVGQCELECPGDNMRCTPGVVEYCSCEVGAVLQESHCIQNHTGTECLTDSLAGYQWPATVVGTTAYAPCTIIDGVSMGNVSRECAAGGVWGSLYAPMCVSPAVQELRRRMLILLTDRSADPDLTAFTADLLAVTMETMFAGDIPQIVDLLHFSIDVLGNISSRSSILSSHQNVVEVGSQLLESNNRPLWEQLTESQVSDTVVDLFAAMDDLGEAVFHQSNTSHIISSNNIALVVLRPNCSRSGAVENEDITISSELLTSPVSGGESQLQLPPTLFSDALGGMNYDCSDVGIVAVVYSGAGPLYSLNGSSLLPTPECEAPLANGRCEWYPQPQCPSVRVNSVIISAVVVSSNQMVNTSMLSEPIIITLQHEDTSLTRPMCSFLDEREVQMEGANSWLTEGCTVVEEASTQNTTVCQCFHLTSFALLMSPTGPPPPNLPLQIVSKVGLSISIICLLITIILLFALKLEEKLHHIHRQLALALCLSQLVFLVGVDRTLVPSPDGVCTAIAAILHYLLLCTFAWQLIEGVHLYVYLVKVFFNERIMWTYYPLGWGVPLIVVAITLGARFCDYGSQYYCWITTENGTNWAFHGPVIGVLAVNILIMAIVTVVILRAARKKENRCLLCTLFHASLVLLPILGVTWILGFFVVGDSLYSQVVEWLFCIFTTLQGVMILVMHCIFNRSVRVAFLKAIGCHKAARQQSTVMSMSRRLTSTATTLRSIFKKPFTRTTTLNCDDITSFQVNDSSVFSGSIAVARPNSSFVQHYELHDITEDKESFSSDNTPELRSKRSPPNGPHLSPPSTPTVPCNGPHP